MPFVDRVRATVPRRRVHLDSAALVVAAMKRSNLVDLDVASIAERLEILTRSLDREADLTTRGRVEARHDLVELLVGRAELLDTITRRPQLTTTPFDPPIVLTGLPAAGVDLLTDLLTTDPGIRVPAPVDLGTLDLASWDFEVRWNVPAYAEWFDRADLTDSYRLARAQLGRRQHDDPSGTWLLASPQHLERTDELAAVFPGAVVVRLHRDPVVAVAELARDVTRRRRSSTTTVHPVTIGRYWSWRFERMADRAEAAGTPHELTILDLHHGDLVRDPIGTVDRVLAAAGRLRTTRTAFEVAEPALADPADYGIDRDDLRRRTARYSSRYDVRPEG